MSGPHSHEALCAALDFDRDDEVEPVFWRLKG